MPKSSVFAKGEQGTLAPDFCLNDPIRQKNVCLYSFKGENVLLIFFRGTWCPFCRQQMNFLAENHERLKSKQVAVLGVVCQSESSLKAYLASHPLPFPLLPDVSRTVAKAYGVHYWLSPEGINLAKPSMFILDNESRFTFRYIGRNMADLPLERVLEKFLSFLSP